MVEVKVVQESEFKKVMKANSGGGAIFEFLLGICMITAAFPTIWMNERRQVRFYKLTSKAEEECVDVQETIDDKSPVLNYNDTKLVRMHGKI